MYYFLFFILLFAIFLIAKSYIEPDHKPYSYVNYLDRETDYKLDQWAMNAENAETVKTAKNNLDKIQSVLSDYEFQGASEYQINQIRAYEKTAADALHQLKQSEWEAKAEEILDDFWDAYYEVTQNKPTMFNYSELTAAKRRCLKNYEKYYETRDFEEYMPVLPQKYIKDYLENDYEPCMDSYYLLEKRLNEAIDAAKPEKKRGDTLRKAMLNYIKSNVSVRRSDMKKQTFGGFGQGEINETYKLLISEYKIVEYKVGNYYFVCLPEDKQMPDVVDTSGTAM